MDLERIHKTAAHWVIETGQGLSPEQQLEFESWLSESPLHRVVFIRLKTLWANLSRLSQLRPLDAELDPDVLLKIDTRSAQVDPIRADSRISAQRASRRIGAAIGAVLLTIAIIFMRLLTEHATRLWDTYIGAKGGSQDVTFSDGTVIRLTIDSEIRVSRRAVPREVVLIRGEAFFRVGKSTGQFMVHAGEAEIRAAPAAFHVRLTQGGDDVEVLVYEGHVSIQGDRVPILKTTPAILVSGGYAHLQRDRVSFVENPQSPSIEQRFNLKERNLVFTGETLAEAVSEFNRYNSRQVVIADASIANFRVGGRFRADDVDSFVAALCVSVRISASATGSANRVTVLWPAGRIDHDLCRPYRAAIGQDDGTLR